MFVVPTVLAADFVPAADNSLQFDLSGINGTINQDVSNLQCPSLVDAQCAITSIYLRNECYRDIYVGVASVGVPVQISVGGEITTITAPGKYSIFFPRGEYLYKTTVQSGSIQSANSISDNPITGKVGSTSPSPTVSTPPGPPV